MRGSAMQISLAAMFGVVTFSAVAVGAARMLFIELAKLDAGTVQQLGWLAGFGILAAAIAAVVLWGRA